MPHLHYLQIVKDILHGVYLLRSSVKQFFPKIIILKLTFLDMKKAYHLFKQFFNYGLKKKTCFSTVE